MTRAFVVKLTVEDNESDEVIVTEMQDALEDFGFEVEGINPWDRTTVEKELGIISQQPPTQAGGPMLGGTV